MALMRKAYEEKHHQAEAKHWFLSARRDLIKGFLRKEKRDIAILEVGCSSGVLVGELQEVGFENTHGLDISPKAVDLARSRGIAAVRVTDGRNFDFPDCYFDYVVSSDVLEHIENEHEALDEWCRVLKSEGKLVIMVPAFQFLWSDHDVANNHFRRYTKRSLSAVLARHRLKIVRATYWNFFLFGVAVAVRSFSKIIPHAKDRSPEGRLYQFGKAVDGALKMFLRIENTLIAHGINFPFGVSVVVIAEK